MHTLRQDLFDQSPQAQIVIDADRDEVIDANSAACRLLGYDHGLLLETKVTDLHAEQLPTLIVFTQAVIDKGRYRTTRLMPRHAAGRELHVEYMGSLIVNGAGDRMILLVINDLAERQKRSIDDAAEDFMGGGLTEWQRAERVFRDIERENRLILRAAGEGIYGVNAEGKTTFVNPVAERLLGWTAEELTGRDIHTIVHHTRPDGSHYPHDECPIYAAFRDGAVRRVNDEVFWRKDGTPVWVEYTSTPIRDRNVIVGAVIVFRDVSERKEADQRLRAALLEVDTLRQRLELENAYLQEEIRTETNAAGIIGRSQAIEATMRQITLVAPTNATVLITGESGTGKELIARAIHEESERKDRPLIRVNCAAIPRELFESEFFGHVKGAFTGALRDRIGRFELADGGTLFLDEVGEIPPELQGKLLRILQEGQFERVGEERTRKVDVRIIAATNIDLKRAVQTKEFREDLYFRLNVFPIESVPLRARRDDIPLLAQHFLNRESRARRSDLALSNANIQTLLRYDWPGNVRELQNVIERATILSRNGRLVFDLPDAPHPHKVLPEQPAAPTPVLTEADMRRRDRGNIVSALRQCGGKISGRGGAAELLAMKPTTLTSRIAAFGITVGDFED
jgi:PAS domain S-box-containing protein